ncbi:MAG: cobalt ECF transporter T component CbiQ [Desulfamplus sp.]
MANLQSNLLDMFYMDTIASGETRLHNLDPRAKVMTTLIFVAAVVSFDKYEIAMLIPFFIYPAVMVAWAELPVVYLFKKMVVLMPFAFFIGMFNPVIDTDIILRVDFTDIVTKFIEVMRLVEINTVQDGIWLVEISGGWISFFSIMVRFFLTVGAALILISITGFDSVCVALQKFGVPKPFIVQLMFLYRYMFVLIDEASRMVRARSLRTFDSGSHMSFNLFIPMIGQLLLRTLDRAQRIHLAMCCRGFEGHINMVRKMNFGIHETLFVAVWSFIFIMFRLYNIPVQVGMLVTELFL